MRREYLERQFAATQLELRMERANALGRAGRNVEHALARCRTVAEALDATPDGQPNDELLEAYRTARAELETARWKLCVQREALGLNDHRRIEQAYPLPPRR